MLVTKIARKEQADREIKSQKNILGSSSLDMMNLFTMPRKAYENESASPEIGKDKINPLP